MYNDLFNVVTEICQFSLAFRNDCLPLTNVSAHEEHFNGARVQVVEHISFA